MVFYPDYEDGILAIFASYGIVITDASNSEHITISEFVYVRPDIVYGGTVEATDFEVANDASLLILFEDEVTLGEYFYIAPNAMLELREIN